jgi:hypothetical protein
VPLICEQLLHGPGEGYAYTWAEVVHQRTARAAMWAAIPIRPQQRFERLANEFWRERFGESGAAVLGVHYRGVDKGGAKLHLSSAALHRSDVRLREAREGLSGVGLIALYVSPTSTHQPSTSQYPHHAHMLDGAYFYVL